MALAFALKPPFAISAASPLPWRSAPHVSKSLSRNTIVCPDTPEASAQDYTAMNVALWKKAASRPRN
eukprot:1592893-Pleurochrysis_carterae.AAC.1